MPDPDRELGLGDAASARLRLRAALRLLEDAAPGAPAVVTPAEAVEWFFEEDR